MSQETVDLVLSVHPAADVDCVPLFRDDDQWRPFAEATAPAYHPDVECIMHEFGGEMRYAGLEGVRSFLLRWMSPWSTYRIETERVIDLGDRVLVLNTDRGQREDSAEEVTGRVAVLWTVRDGLIARLDAYTTRADAFKDAGLTE